MKDNRRDFFKKSAALAATASLAGISSAIAGSQNNGQYKNSPANTDELARDGGMDFSLAMNLQSPRIPLAKQMDVLGAVTSVRPEGDLKPWDPKAIIAVKEGWEKLGMHWNVVEGPPSLGEKTKLGLEGRDEEIANFITFMKNVKQYGGIDIICYNWMPVISWFRTKMDKPGRGGALVTAFDYDDIKNAPLTPYGEVSKESLWKNLEYFLKAVVPEAEKIGMKLAMHPDDPQVDAIKGISRIMTTVDNFKKLVDLYPSPNNGICLCQGNFSLMGADIPTVAKYFGKRKLVHFVHFRNVRGGKFKFEETFHDEGQIDMYNAMKAYYEIGFKGPIRPDHVPTMAGDSNERPGYSTIGTLFAIGYMRGLVETISKQAKKS